MGEPSGGNKDGQREECVARAMVNDDSILGAVNCLNQNYKLSKKKNTAAAFFPFHFF